MAGRHTIWSGSTFEEQIGYAGAVVVDDWIQVSGTTGFDYATMTISDDVVEQCEQCLHNIDVALAEAGCSLADVVRVRYLLPDRDDVESCWPTLRRVVGHVRPEATMLVCGLSDPRMKIEIEVDARRPSPGAATVRQRSRGGTRDERAVPDSVRQQRPRRDRRRRVVSVGAHRRRRGPALRHQPSRSIRGS